MPAITSANVANAIVKLVAADALPALMGNLVLGNLVNRDYEPTLAQEGDTVHVCGKGIIPVVLNTHVEATFQIPDVTKVLCVPGLLRIYMQPAISAISEKIETDLASLRAGFTAHVPIDLAGAGVNQATIDQADTDLFAARVASSTPKYLAVDPATYSAMRKLPRFTEFQCAADAGLRSLVDGTLGKIGSFFVFRSREVKPGAGFAFVKDALGLVIRRLPQPLPGTGAIAEYAELGNFGMRVTMSYQPNTLSQQFTVDVLYGVAVLREDFGVQVNG